jgi:photosystem II stability/assembly factor-like uncharacterized protein
MAALGDGSQAGGWRRTSGRLRRLVAAAVCLLATAGSTGIVAVTGSGLAPASAAGASGSWQADHTFAATPGPFDAISCATSSTCLAGGGGAVVATNDGGTTWAVKSVPSSLATLSGISCPSATSCIAVGATTGGTGAVAATTNGGTTWTAQSVPSGTGALSGVSCPSTTACLAVGSAGGDTVVATTNGGATWAAKPALAGVATLLGVSCPSTTVCTAVGSAAPTGSCKPFPSCRTQPLIATTTDGGTTWAEQSYNQGQDEGGTFSGVSCPSTAECTAVGDAVLVGANVEGIAITLSSGTCAMGPGCNQLDYLSSTTGLTGVSCPTTSICTAVGNGQIAVAGPASWAVQSAPVDSVEAVSCPSGSDCLAGGGVAPEGPGTVVRSTDGGTTWANVFALPNGVYSLAAVSCPVSSVCTAVGETQDAGQIRPGQDAGPGVVTRTTDGGTTWATQTLPAGVGSLISISCYSTQDCVALGGTPTDTAPVVVETTNGGTTWQQGTLPPGLTGVGQVSCASATGCTAVGQGSGGVLILDTTNGGTTWSTETAPGGLYELLSVSCPSVSTCTAVGETTSDAAAIVTTRNGGTTWMTQAPPSGLFDLVSIACPSTNVCSAAGAVTVNGPPAIVSTTNGGTTWVSEQIPTGLSTLSGIACAATTNCSAVGQATPNGPGAVIGTTDGSTWTDESIPPSYDIAGIACPAPGACMATGLNSSFAAFVIGQAPITSLLVPANAAIVADSVTLDASASSPVGLASVRFEIATGPLSNQVVSGSTLTAYGWIGSWNSTTVPNGTYALVSVAMDTNGVTTASTPITVTVDNPPPPTTAVLLPSNGATQSGSEYLDASASANVSKVSFEVTGGSLTDHVISGSTLTAYGWIGGWNTTSVPNGTYTLQSVASTPTAKAVPARASPSRWRTREVERHRRGSGVTRPSIRQTGAGPPAASSTNHTTRFARTRKAGMSSPRRTAATASRLFSPVTVKRARRAALITGRVRVSRGWGLRPLGSSVAATNSPGPASRVGAFGKRDAVCPSAPRPRWIRSIPGAARSSPITLWYSATHSSIGPVVGMGVKDPT